MINAILLFGAAHANVSGVPDSAWVRMALAKHSTTRQVVGAAELTTSTTSSASEIQVVLTGTHLQIVQSRVSNDPLIKAREALINATRVHTGALLQRGQISEANLYLEQFVQEHFDLSPDVADVRTDCQLLFGNNRGAADTVLRVIREETSHPRGLDLKDYYLRLSVALSSLGEVYEGQREYCQGCLSEYFKGEHPGQTLAPDKRSQNDARSVMVLSVLTLGMKNSGAAVPYLELALKLDPTNVTAAREVLRRYTLRGRYSDIRRVASEMVAKLPPGSDREEFRREIARVAGMPDKPQHYIDEDRTVIHP